MTRGLIKDERAAFVGEDEGVIVLLERRRATCAHLAQCEDEWIAVESRRASQAKCPAWCRYYRERATVAPPVTVGSSLGDVRWE